MNQWDITGRKSMGVYRQCPACGNIETNVGVNVCNDCHWIFCDTCATKDFDHFPLPFRTTHCPRCNSTNLRGTGVIDHNWHSGW